MRYVPILSVDVEDWLQSTWNRDFSINKVAHSNMIMLLHRLERLNVKVTMFILGKFAETFPDIIKEIANSGHEVAAHGYGHLEIFTQSREHFREDIRRNKDYIEQLIGKEVIGYRAPDFSIIKDSIWALEELVNVGYIYDSSIYPVNHSHYGIPRWPLSPHSINLESGKSIFEFPISAYPIGNKNLPIGGGGYHRLFPGFIIRLMMKKILEDRPFVTYMHPYEFNSNEFKGMKEKIPFYVRLHQGLFRSRFGSRFESYVTKFGGITFSKFIKENKIPSISINQIRLN